MLCWKELNILQVIGYHTSKLLQVMQQMWWTGKRINHSCYQSSLACTETRNESEQPWLVLGIRATICAELETDHCRAGMTHLSQKLTVMKEEAPSSARQPRSAAPVRHATGNATLFLLRFLFGVMATKDKCAEITLNLQVERLSRCK